MATNEIITLVVTIINSVFVAILSIRGLKTERMQKLADKKKSWYKSEVISEEKINAHLESLRQAINADCDTFKRCNMINNAMLEFFYNSVNYVNFFDSKYCESLKRGIMEAIDELLLSALADDLTPREKDKILKIYRIKMVYLFYEFDIKTEEGIK